MSDDPMEQLTAAARARADDEARNFDPRWRALVHGTLSEDEEAALRQEGVESPRQQDAIDAFEPIDATATARIAAQARTQLRAFQPTANDDQATVHHLPSTIDQPVATAPHRRRRAGWSRRLAALAAAVVATLGLAYLANVGGPAAPEGPLAAFHMTLDGGRSPVRSAPDVPRNVFGPGSLLAMDLLPETALEGAIEVGVFIVRDETMTRVSLPDRAITKHDGGAIEIRAEIGRDWSPAAGAVTLLTVISRPGDLPSTEALGAHRAALPHERNAPPWQLFVREITLVND